MKDKAYLDRLLKKFMEKDFDGIVLVEFTKGSKERSFLKDTERLKGY